jgi:GDP-L-fucose synthase
VKPIKLLITGAGPSSFLGKHVLKEISTYSQYEVLAPSSSELNLLSEWNVLKYFYENKIDRIIHMAANCGGILKNINNPFDMAYDNLKMAINLFTTIKTYKIQHLVSLGTTCSYPIHSSQPMNEADLFNGPEESSNIYYAEAKRMLIRLTDSYKKQYGFKSVSLIPANLYGEYDHFSLNNSHVIPALIRKFDDAIINNSKEVKCWGSGSATREFLYGGDAAVGICRALDMEINEELPVNIGTGSDISIYNLAYLIAEIINFKGDIVFTGEVSDGQPKRRLDVGRAKELMNFTASTSLRDGLEKTILWFRNNREEILSKE